MVPPFSHFTKIDFVLQTCKCTKSYKLRIIAIITLGDHMLSEIEDALEFEDTGSPNSFFEIFKTF